MILLWEEGYLRNQYKYTIDIIRNILKEKDNIEVIDNTYIDSKTKILCRDFKGYYIYIIWSNYLIRHGVGRWIDKSNDYSIYNINRFLRLNNIPFECISTSYISANDDLVFRCKRCGEIITTSWKNIYKNDNQSRHRIICKNCDGRTESLHALVLKQMFMYYYPDTSLEDKSYRSLKTNKICPTDIVNHRLKIAIEIQSQWHDFEDIKVKDKMKKEYWLSKGYKFYALDIRDYSILGMCQIFFDIFEIPEWINYNYRNIINIKEAQTLLNSGLSVSEVGKHMGVDKHRIYDAIYSKKLFYPQNYKNIRLLKNKNHIDNKSQESQETTGYVW